MGFRGRWKMLSKQSFIGRIVVSLGVLSVVLLVPGKGMIGDFRESCFYAALLPRPQLLYLPKG